MRATQYECVTIADIRTCLEALAPRTAIVDIEPLIAYWDTGTEELDQGIDRFLQEVRSLPSLELIVFATNSLRQPSTPPAAPGVTYHARALKPFSTSPFRNFPTPGVVIGDQTATDGVLASRLNYTFLRYKVPMKDRKLGPQLMAALGTVVRPLFLTRPHPPATP
jgi:predicted HAD superfamily phosphohydrolase YqeG